MVRSSLCLMLATLGGSPAWFVDVNALPHTAQVIWLAGLLGAALLGGWFWAKDGK